MTDDISREMIPIPAVKRFPSYLRILRQARESGRKNISATELAEELSLKPIQVRKDISSTGIEGKPRIGFVIDELITAINHALGWDNPTEALIVGCGNLGSAIAAYGGFDAYGLKIVAAFDTVYQDTQSHDCCNRRSRFPGAGRGGYACQMRHTRHMELRACQPEAAGRCRHPAYRPRDILRGAVYKAEEEAGRAAVSICHAC